MYLNQRKLLYLPSENNYLDDQIDFNFREVFIDVEKNLKLKAWLIENDFKNKKTLVFFHGNAGNLSNRTYKLNQLSKLDLNIIILAWRSFSGNEGEPSEQNLYNDAKKTIDWLNSRGVKNKNIILYGESLGTGIAVELGQTNQFGGIILESPFTSMEILAQKYYPYLPAKIILKDKYKSIEKINKIKFPMHVMHGKKDNIVPFYMGEEIFNKYVGVKSNYFNDNDDHMMEFNKGLIQSIDNFIKSLN